MDKRVIQAALTDHLAGNAAFGSISCSANGSCSAGGSYSGGSGIQVLVVDETNGTWGTAQELPGIAALNTGGDAGLGSLSCAGAGECSAGGSYALPGGRQTQAYVVTETNGTWGTAIQVPGTAALNTGNAGRTNSVWCGAPGNCGAGGFYTDGISSSG
jgi:hypothetical protein